MKAKYIVDPQELRQLTAFFAWTAWASAARRPGLSYSYTNNFPFDPLAGNTPPAAAYLWSALSLITLLAGTAAILFAFGKFDYLGWKGTTATVHPRMLPGVASPSQRATIKFFVVVTLLFLVQVLVGAATAHNRVEPGSFYGLNLYEFFPSNILRTWHLQLAIFWIATAYVGGGLLLAGSLGETEPRGQSAGVHFLFWALVVVVAGSLLGELLGINQLLGHLWFWFGHQGWEYLDLGRGWQILLAVGLIIWVVLLFRALAPALKDPERREISWLFLLAALAIPLFYLPAFFFGSTTNYTVVDNWRFWIIHLWVEGFFELLVTVMVAVTFFRLGVVSRQTAARVALPGRHPLPGQRHRRHRPPLVLDRTVPGQHGPVRHVFGHGGGAPDAPYPGRLGLRQINPEGSARSAGKTWPSRINGPFTSSWQWASGISWAPASSASSSICPSSATSKWAPSSPPTMVTPP